MTRAILWAQWRATVNYMLSGRQGRWWIVTAVMLAGWYGFWLFVAFAVAHSIAGARDVGSAVQRPLMLIFAGWQIVPLALASAGLNLDLARLTVYPVPHSRLFFIEVALRLSTALEVAIVTVGLFVGLVRNPGAPWWLPLALVPFVAINLCLSAGLRDLFTRLLSRRYFREAVVFGIVLLAGLPQLLLARGVPDITSRLIGPWWPWSITSPALIVWTVAAFAFGRWQFERSLRFDAAAARSEKRGTGPGMFDSVFRLPSLLFRDPLAVLVEKEMRFLSRAPKFRLVFLMGFSFGLLVWIPIAMRSEMGTNYLTIVSAYALLLLGDICFWNILGLDRTAAQTYFVAPLRMETVLVAKNLAASFFILLEICMVTVACSLLRLPLTLQAVAEAFATTAVFALFLFAAGNLFSIHHPRSINPTESWRNTGVGRAQALILLVYPVMSAPVLLAHGARYAFDSQAAFYGVLALDALIGAIIYSVSLESAASRSFADRERITAALSSGEGPVGA